MSVGIVAFALVSALGVGSAWSAVPSQDPAAGQQWQNGNGSTGTGPNYNAPTPDSDQATVLIDGVDVQGRPVRATAGGVMDDQRRHQPRAVSDLLALLKLLQDLNAGEVVAVGVDPMGQVADHTPGLSVLDQL